MSRIEIFSPTVLKKAENDWDASADEGQLAIDVADRGDALIVLAPMAGVAPESIEVYIQSDLLTIRGVRSAPMLDGAAPLHEECFWGRFSRTAILPVEVKGELATAEYANGVLTLSIPKREMLAKVPIRIIEE